MQAFLERVEDLVPSRSDVITRHSREGVGLVSYQVRYKGSCYSLREWRHLVYYQVAQSGTEGLSGEGGGFISF